MSNIYIGISIGPIDKTMQMGTKTRETWAASYLISYICRSLIEEFNSKGCKPENYIMPYWAPAENIKPGAGFLADKIILAESDTFSYLDIIDAISTVKKSLADKIIKALTDNSKEARYLKRQNGYQKVGISEIVNNKEKATEYLQKYFQIYSCEVDLSAEIIPGINRLRTINTVLDQLELRYSLVDADPNPLRLFLHAVNHTFLLQDCFHEKITHFDSLPEIALRELRTKYETKYDTASETVYETIKKATEDETKIAENEVIDEDDKEPFASLIALASSEEEDFFRTYHNYVAVVIADGDKLGKLLKAIEAKGKDNSQFQTDIEAFSKRLHDFSKKAYAIIAGSRYTTGKKEDWGYGAAPVYMGGDDLLFFAPVANIVMGKKKTIFDVVKDIDDCFSKCFDQNEYQNLKDDDDNEIKPCISFGVYISYIKHPLREAVMRSRELLYEAKNSKFETRNRLNFEVRKHSGSTFGAIINKSETQLFSDFLMLINNEESPDKEQFLSSVTQKMREQKSTVTSVLANKWHLDAYFDDEFNKEVHASQRRYLDQCRDYLFSVSQLDPSKNPENEKLLENFFAALKLNHFLHARTND